MSSLAFKIRAAHSSSRTSASDEVLIMTSRFTFVVRFFSLVVAGLSICISSQPAQASTQTGRLVVQRSPTFGSKTYLQHWIDGNKVANIGPGHRYDESIPAGHHVLAVNYTPRTRHQPTSKRLTVRPGRGVCIHSHSRIRSGREFSAVKSYSSITERSPA